MDLPLGRPLDKSHNSMPEERLVESNAIVGPPTANTTAATTTSTTAAEAKNRDKYSIGNDVVKTEISKTNSSSLLGRFYDRDAALSGDALSLMPDFIEDNQRKKSLESISSRYSFPPSGIPLQHKSSFSETYASGPSSSFKDSPQKGLKTRSHSISITDPVCRSTYESIAQSPAASFLAQFAQSDDWRNRPTLEDGSVIDRYRLGRVIGRGSFSECREASYTDSQEEEGKKTLAMKIVKSDEDHGQNLEEFDRELAIWQRLRHKNILPLIDFIRLDSALVAVTPIAENGTLLDYINQHGPFDEQDARILFREICEAVAHMHQDRGVIHRDIKLDNILLDKQMQPYVCDFGLSECIDPTGSIHEAVPVELDSLKFVEDLDPSETSTSRTRTEDELFCKGSLWYLPPEELEPSLMKRDQQEGSTLDETECRMKGDIWSLGIVLYGMIMGKLPFTDDFLPRLHVSILSGKYPPLPTTFSLELCNLMAKLLTVEIERRPNIEAVLKHPWFNL